MNKKVLIVDDDPIVRDLLAAMVDNAGHYETDLATDGVEGISKIGKEAYDIVFTDIKMPRMGGLELLREIKKKAPRTPVVVITAYAYLETAVAAMKEGAMDFITKPFKANDIKFILDRVRNDMTFLKRLASSGQNALPETMAHGIYEQLREISLMHTIFLSLDELRDNQTLFENCVEFASKLLDAREIALALIEGAHLTIIQAKGMPQRTMPIDKTVVDIMTNKRHVILDVGSVNPFSPSLLASQMIIIPLVLNNEVYGIFAIGTKASGYNFTDDEIDLALTFVRKLSLKIENNALYDIFHGNMLNTIKSLVTTIEVRDSYTRIHSERVTEISLTIGRIMNLRSDELETIRFGGYLHDVGKIGVRDTVLLKPSALSDDERAEIQLHPLIGENIIKPLGSFPNELLLIRHHHERYDGKGYPDGLGATDIPLQARIIAVADTYDSITSSRPYRKAQTFREAVAEIRKCSKTQFDPVIVEAFLETQYAVSGEPNAPEQE